MMRCQQAVFGQKRGKNSKKGQKKGGNFQDFSEFFSPVFTFDRQRL